MCLNTRLADSPNSRQSHTSTNEFPRDRLPLRRNTFDPIRLVGKSRTIEAEHWRNSRIFRKGKKQSTDCYT